jgi:hypothetical protein
MRTLITAAGIVLLASTAWAAVSAHVFKADEQTPLPWLDPNTPDVYQDIMVGTRLTIFIISDQPGGWDGHLWHSHENEAIGGVSGRGKDPNPCYEGSLLPAVVKMRSACVRDTNNRDGVGLHLACGRDAVPGEWFVVDYHAKALGTCPLGFYAIEHTDPNEHPDGFNPVFDLLEPPPSQSVGLQALLFHHVPTRDLSLDSIVDFHDFALLASAWQTHATDPNQLEEISPDPNAPPSADLNADRLVDATDLAMFSAYWLERTDVNLPTSEPNEAPAEEYPVDL